MTELFSPTRSGRAWAVVVALVCSGACTDQVDDLRHHQQKIDSLTATASAIADAWLAGTVSRAYADTALDQTFKLLQQERQDLAGAPEQLSEPGTARLLLALDSTTNNVATLRRDMDRNDVAAVRTQRGIRRTASASGLR